MQASVGSHCLECAKASKPTVSTRARYWNARQQTIVTYVLIAINVAVFLYVVISTPDSVMGGDNGAIGYWRLAVSKDLLTSTIYPDIPDGFPEQWYRLVSSGFLHFGILHLALNMYGLYMLGQILEPGIGRVRFALVYFASLLGGTAGALLLSPDVLTGGASGAVFGLLGVVAVGYLLRGINPLSTALGGVLIINVLLSFRPGVSLGGHLGGLVAGALCGLVVVAPAHHSYPKWATYAAPIAIAALSVAVSVVIAS